MRSTVDIFQGMLAHLRINLCGVQVAVTKHILDMPDVRAVIQHVRGHCVPKQMIAAPLGNPGQGLVVSDLLPNLRLFYFESRKARTGRQ